MARWSQGEDRHARGTGCAVELGVPDPRTPRHLTVAGMAAQLQHHFVDLTEARSADRILPRGVEDERGGCHGALWHDDKLWIASLRLRGNLRVDPKTWEPEFFIPFYQAPDRVRYHGIAWDNGTIWQIVGNDSKRYSEYRPCLVRYEAATGKVLETVDFMPNSCDPHGLAMHEGKLISCDAGIHPGWPNNDSPTSGWIFQIEVS